MIQVHLAAFLIDSWLVLTDIGQDGSVEGAIYAQTMSGCVIGPIRVGVFAT